MTASALLLAAALAGEPEPATSSAVVVHRLESEYQSGPTTVSVVQPSTTEPGRRYPVLYVLPVEAGAGKRWGDVVATAERLRVADRFGVIVVYPTFAQLPWYADHPTDAGVRQESHFLKVVVPFVERNSPALAERSGRLLLGFSKSGWGAFSLLLRHPEHFERAVAWDAPLTMNAPGRYGSGPIFGTPENFAKYQLTKLVADRAKTLGDELRLIHLGYDNFREHHHRFERLLLEHSVPHVFQDGPKRRHHWESGWFEEAVRLVVSPARTASGK